MVLPQCLASLGLPCPFVRLLKYLFLLLGLQLRLRREERRVRKMVKTASGRHLTHLDQGSIMPAVVGLRDPDLREGGRKEGYEAACGVPFAT